jgi:ferredoxin
MLGLFKRPQELVTALRSTVETKSHSCVRVRHKNAACNRCVTLCPAGAISVGKPGGMVKVNPDLCVGCGICVARCPTGVFRMKWHSEQDWHRQAISTCQAGRINIVCEQCPGLKDKSGHFVVGCLGGIGVSRILGLIGDGAQTFIFEANNCEKCSLGFGHTLLGQDIAELISLSEGIAPLAGMACRSSREDRSVLLKISTIGNRKDRAASVEDTATMTRRGFFTQSKTTLMQAASFMVNDSKATKQRLLNLTANLPVQRQHLIETMAKMQVLSGKKIHLQHSAILGNRHVNSRRCINCGICNRFCPTGALRAHEGNLLFAPIKCTNCHLCEDVCHDKAFEPLTEISTDQFFIEKPLDNSNAT